MKHKTLSALVPAGLAVALIMAGCSQPAAPDTPAEPSNGEPEVTMNQAAPAAAQPQSPTETMAGTSTGSEQSEIKVATLDVPGMT
ncbi:MAG: hypothetical protein AB7F50_02345 [Fimbriimonadaceae bacterium]